MLDMILSCCLFIGNLISKKIESKLLKNLLFVEYIFCSNNACKSINNLLNNFIQINSKISLDKFETIIKILFIRLEKNRNNNICVFV